MSAKRVSLAVHRNTVEKHRQRSVRASALQQVGGIMRSNDVRAWAFVGIDADGKMHAAWDTGSILPLWAWPETVSNALRRDIEESGVNETWRPPLPLKG